jgi:molecular chaperone IbpA
MLTRLLKDFDIEAMMNPLSLNQEAYPPYNLYRKGDSFYVELALAGFSREEIDIEVTDMGLVITGNPVERDDTLGHNLEHVYFERRIARRPFKRKFTTPHNSKATSAEFVNGLLRVQIDIIDQEKKNAKKLDIN